MHAQVIENAFWVWAEDCAFFFYPIYYSAGAKNGKGVVARSDWGQRPSVIIRGNSASLKQGIDTVYLLHFGRIVVSGGGFQYQQLVNSDQ
jgi:hypothetical protein